MVIKGKSVAGAGRVADHLARTDTNERMDVKELRGVAAEDKDMRGALREMEAVAAGSARCQKPFYHASINTRADERLTDEQRLRAIDRLEKELGLTGQPRVIVVHEKQGREHCHVVWSRVNSDTMRVIHDGHNFRKHEIVARELEREFGHERVQGAHIERDGKPRPERAASHKEHQQGDRTGTKPKEAREQLTNLWRSTDSAEGFKAALEDKGWRLAKGDRRDLVAVDRHGGVHSLSRRIEGATAKDIRTRLAGIDRDKLPSVAEARAAQYERYGRPQNLTKSPARPSTRPRSRSPAGRQVVRVIGSAARPTPGASRAASRAAGGFLKGASKLADGVANVVESLLGGAPSKPPKGSAIDDNKRPLDPGPSLTEAAIDEARRLDQEQRSANRQKYLRIHSREIPDEKQRDADIQRDPTTGRERTRGE